MPPKAKFRHAIVIGILVISAAAVAGLMSGRDPGGAGSAQSGGRQTTATVQRQDFVQSLRLSGTVEAVESTTIATPRLAGPQSQSLVITKLIKPGAAVRKGDLIVEFDRQTQLAAALDRRAELNDLDQQIRKKDAAERAARARDDGEILLAESTLSRATLETAKNELLPKITAEKNDLAVEQAQATVNQHKATYALKRKAAEADIQILRIRRDRAEHAMRQAETNAERMAVIAPIEGMAVLRTVWKSNTMAEVQEGEEVRAGVPVVDVVNPATMRVRARVSQSDVNDLRVGQEVRVGLDAYADLSFDGRIAQISPIGMVSTLSPRVRVFVVLVDVNGAHPNLMPDLTASLDVTIARLPNALVVPRDAVGHDGQRPFVRVQRGSSYADQTVTLGPVSALHAVLASGVQEGVVVARNIAGTTGDGLSAPAGPPPQARVESGPGAVTPDGITPGTSQ
jgi:multidrug efflux pump subunit AcrA (membrane-fusion protein)